MLGSQIHVQTLHNYGFPCGWGWSSGTGQLFHLKLSEFLERGCNSIFRTPCKDSVHRNISQSTLLHEEKVVGTGSGRDPPSIVMDSSHHRYTRGKFGYFSRGFFIFLFYFFLLLIFFIE